MVIKMIKKFKDINVTKTNFLSDFLKLIPITKQTSFFNKEVTNCYDYLSLNDINTLINMLKSHYRYRYCYEDEIFEQLKAVNNYAIPKLLSKINVLDSSYLYDFFENYSYTEITNTSSNEILDSDLKRADTPTTVSGDLVNEFTTEQVKDVSDRFTTSTLEVTKSEKGSVIDKLLQITSFNEEIRKYLKEYINEFSGIFSVVDFDDLEATAS